MTYKSIQEHETGGEINTKQKGANTKKKNNKHDWSLSNKKKKKQNRQETTESEIIINSVSRDGMKSGDKIAVN